MFVIPPFLVHQVDPRLMSLCQDLDFPILYCLPLYVHLAKLLPLSKGLAQPRHTTAKKKSQSNVNSSRSEWLHAK